MCSALFKEELQAVKQLAGQQRIGLLLQADFGSFEKPEQG